MSTPKRQRATPGTVFRVEEERAGATLAAALRAWQPGLSWSSVRRQIATRRVQINGNLALDEHRRLQAGDVVKLLEHSLAAPPTDHDVRVRYLDDHLVVVEKPSGMTTIRHPEERNWPRRRKQIQPTLDEVLPTIIARLTNRTSRQMKGKPVPLRPVHRLDRETSGLMVFARTVEAERKLMQQFRRHTIERRYVAVALGQVEAQRIETYLARDRGDGRRGSTELAEAGKRAVTHVQPLESLPGYTIVECRLETGRTHQIRIHLSERGHLVCGDKVYCQPLFRPPIADPSGAPRLALHAAELGFVHPVTGETLHFRMPLPADLTQFIRRLRATK